MACILRSTSPRGALYVITHVSCIPSDGRSAANIHQLMARCGGKTRALRSERGYDGVTVLMAKCDFELVKELYDVTAQLLLVCGTGQVEDLDAWRFVELDTRYQSAIKHANESLKPKDVVGRLKMLPTNAAEPIGKPCVPICVRISRDDADLLRSMTARKDDRVKDVVRSILGDMPEYQDLLEAGVKDCGYLLAHDASPFGTVAGFDMTKTCVARSKAKKPFGIKGKDAARRGSYMNVCIDVRLGEDRLYILCVR